MPFALGVPRPEDVGANAERLKDISPGPRYKLAAKLYASGNAKNKKEAAELAGVNYQYFLMLSVHNTEIKEIIGDMEDAVDEKLLETPKLLTRFGREAVMKVAQIMRTTKDEEVALKAAKDLADRSEDTSTIKKAKISSEQSISPDAARALAEALVTAARHRLEHSGNAAAGSTVSSSVTSLPSGEVMP